MKLKVLDLDRTESNESVVLNLSSNQDIIVGNEVVDKALGKYRLNLATLAMLCASGMFILDIPGAIVEHAAGDDYADADGTIIGEYKSDGFHIENPDGYSRPTLRLQTNSLEQMTFVASISGVNPELLSTTSVIQQIPTSSSS